MSKLAKRTASEIDILLSSAREYLRHDVTRQEGDLLRVAGLVLAGTVAKKSFLRNDTPAANRVSVLLSYVLSEIDKDGVDALAVVMDADESHALETADTERPPISSEYVVPELNMVMVARQNSAVIGAVDEINRVADAVNKFSATVQNIKVPGL
jgi:hypothetical protein